MTTATAHRRVATGLARSGASENSLELRGLRCFVSVARTGNLGRAAQELRISQPTISHQLRKLEEELGTQLLIRHGRGVTLTPPGACLLERLDTVMPLLAAPLEHDSGLAMMRGAVSFALPAEIGPLLVPPLVAQFLRQWPLATLDIKEGASGVLDTWVLNRKVDVAIVQNPADLDNLRIEPLVTERLGVIASPRSALAESSSPLRLRDLEHLPLILPNPQHWIPRLLARASFQCGIRLEPVFQVDSVSLIKEMVRSGLGCSVLPGAAARDEIDRGALVFRMIDHPSLATTHAIAIRQTSHDPRVLNFVAVLREVIGSLVAGQAWLGATAVKPPIQRSFVQTACPAQPGPLEAGRLHGALAHHSEYLSGD